MASVAYGPEAIVLVLATAGAHGLGFTLPVTLAIAGPPAVLVASYRQVIAAFPDGGGSYAVARTHLGARTSLVAAASPVLDYVLNVCVAVTAGVAALTSAFPALHDDRLGLCLAVLMLITAVTVCCPAPEDRAQIHALEGAWAAWDPGVPLVLLASERRTLGRPPSPRTSVRSWRRSRPPGSPS